MMHLNDWRNMCYWYSTHSILQTCFKNSITNQLTTFLITLADREWYRDNKENTQKHSPIFSIIKCKE